MAGHVVPVGLRATSIVEAARKATSARRPLFQSNWQPTCDRRRARVLVLGARADADQQTPASLVGTGSASALQRAGFVVRNTLQDEGALKYSTALVWQYTMIYIT